MAQGAAEAATVTLEGGAVEWLGGRLQDGSEWMRED